MYRTASRTLRATSGTGPSRTCCATSAMARTSASSCSRRCRTVHAITAAMVTPTTVAESRA